MSLLENFERNFPDFEIGDTVYAVITPQTIYGTLRTYAPKPYFVLETKVDRERTYGFDTDYVIFSGMAFLNLEDAKKRLVEVFAQETDGVLAIEKVHLVSMQELARATERIERKIDSEISRPS